MNKATKQLIEEAKDVLINFYDQVERGFNPSFSIELYELIYNLVSYAIEESSKDTSEILHTKIAVEELSDRLSDAISENIQLKVQLRAIEADALINSFTNTGVTQ